MPNERAWAYRWIFKTVFPTLFGKVLLDSVGSIITDGDAQEIKELEEATSDFCKNAIRIRCSWHIVDRGWQTHLQGVDLGWKKNK